jgi:hypothetical protein
VLETDRPGGLHVLPEGAEIETLEVVRPLDEDPQLLPAFERVVDRPHQRVVVLVAAELPREPEPEHARRQPVDPLDHAAGVCEGHAAERRTEVHR